MYMQYKNSGIVKKGMLFNTNNNEFFIFDNITAE
jgi:hypothetical protein